METRQSYFSLVPQLTSGNFLRPGPFLSTTALSSQWPSSATSACGSTRSCQCSSTSHVLLRSAYFIYAVYARFVDNSVATSLHDWCRLSCCRDWTTATLSSHVFQRQLWHRCSESWTRQRDSFSTWKHVTMQLPPFASCIGYPLHNGSSTSCVCSFIRPHTRLHLRPAHTGRLQQLQPLSSTDGAAFYVAAPRVWNRQQHASVI